MLYFLTAIVGQLFISALIAPPGALFGISGNAAATANNILAHEGSYRFGFALGLISIACYAAVTALFYQLFGPVSRSLPLIAAFVGLMGLAVDAAGSLFQLAPLVVLGGSPHLSVFDVKQLQALALLSLNLSAQVGDISLVFAGLFNLVVGYLVFRSTFLARVLGALMALPVWVG